MSKHRWIPALIAVAGIAAAVVLLFRPVTVEGSYYPVVQLSDQPTVTEPAAVPVGPGFEHCSDNALGRTYSPFMPHARQCTDAATKRQIAAGIAAGLGLLTSAGVWTGGRRARRLTTAAAVV